MDRLRSTISQIFQLSDHMKDYLELVVLVQDIKVDRALSKAKRRYLKVARKYTNNGFELLQTDHYFK